MYYSSGAWWERFADQEDAFERFVRRSAHEVFIQIGDGSYALLSAVNNAIAIHRFGANILADPTMTRYGVLPDGLHDGKGWNLSLLLRFISENDDARGLLLQLPRPIQRTNNDYHSVPEIVTGGIMRRKSSDASRATQAAQARLAREKQRGSSCLMLSAKAIRDIVPCIDAELVKFFVLAASYGNPLGVAFPGTREFWRLGYHPEKTAAFIAQLEQVGLMRYLRKDARDTLTGAWLPDAYQFNPALYFIRRRLRSEAAALTDLPFAALPMLDVQPLIGSLYSNADHYPPPESSIKNHHQWTNAMNHHHHQKQSFEGGRGAGSVEGANGSGRAKNKSASANGSTSGAGAKPKTKDKKQDSSAVGASNPPAPAGAKKGVPGAPALPRRQFDTPLPDETAENLAHDIKATCGTRLWQARELVNAFGVTRVNKAHEQLVAAMRKGGIRSPFGLMRTWLERGMIDAEDQFFDLSQHPYLKTVIDSDQWDYASTRQPYEHLLNHRGCPGWLKAAFARKVVHNDLAAATGD